jgi:hypothetical protein
MNTTSTGLPEYPQAGIPVSTRSWHVDNQQGTLFEAILT